MKIVLQENEQIVKESRANHYLNHMLMVGRLYLTNVRLVFIAHPLNFRQYSLNMPLKEIKNMELRNNLKYFSHGFIIHHTNQNQHRFSVWGRKKWRIAMDKALAEKKS